MSLVAAHQKAPTENRLKYWIDKMTCPVDDSLFPSNVFSWAHEQSEIVEDLEFIHGFNNMGCFFFPSQLFNL